MFFHPSAFRYDNSVIVFISDNGARFISTVEGADKPNYPLKGFKNTIYEGGARVPGFVHSPLLEQPGRRYQGLLHMVDFLPTLVNLAGGEVPANIGLHHGSFCGAKCTWREAKFPLCLMPWEKLCPLLLDL